MCLVVLVFGASGSGKSTLMEYLTLAGPQYSIHMKGTDRAKRNYDGIEIKYVDQVDESDYDYIYETYGYRYGIQRAQIDAAITAKKHHFIICNDIEVIRRVRRDYGSRVKVIFHHFDAPRSALLKIQQARDISDDEIELRLAKTEVLYKTFVEEGNLFDGVLHNHFGAKPDAMVKELEQLLFKLSTTLHVEDLPKKIFDQVNKIADQLERERTARNEDDRPYEPNFVFVIMPMDNDIPSLPDTYRTIKRASRAARMRASRIDDIVSSVQITEKLHNNIQLAEFVVADLSEERPNVYYEVGYANALGKPIRLIAKADTSIHFDLQAYHIELYQNYGELEESLKKWLRHMRKSSRQVDPNNTELKIRRKQSSKPRR
jgi:guanylate kinase